MRKWAFLLYFSCCVFFCLECACVFYRAAPDKYPLNLGNRCSFVGPALRCVNCPACPSSSQCHWPSPQHVELGWASGFVCFCLFLRPRFTSASVCCQSVFPSQFPATIAACDFSGLRVFLFALLDNCTIQLSTIIIVVSIKLAMAIHFFAYYFTTSASKRFYLEQS